MNGQDNLLNETKKRNPILKVFLILIVSSILLGIGIVIGMNIPKETTNKQDSPVTENNNKEDSSTTEKNEDKEDIADEDKEDITNEDTIKIVGTKYSEFDKIIKSLTTKKTIKSHQSIESFYLNTIHTESPGVWGDGNPEMYYYSEDGTYIINISEYDVGSTEVLRVGTWEIKDNQLVLSEKYILTLVNGKLTDVPVPGGSTEKGYIDYDFEVKTSSNVTTYQIKHIGTSSFKEDMNEDNPNIKPDNYQINSKDMYSLEVVDCFEYLPYAQAYYEAIK